MIAAVLAGALVAGVLIVPLALSSGGNDAAGPVAAAPRCLDAWNSDEITRLFGRHLAISHQYTSVEITRLDESGEAPASGADGNCAVVFASPRLDPEPGAAAQALIEGKWRPLSDLPGVEAQQLGRLQSEAVSLANASLGTDGRLTATSP